MKELKIKKITINNEMKAVFDIEVMESNQYVLENGLLSHNSGFVFASSIIVAMNKLKLKIDEDGVKTSEVHGIRSKLKCVKSRYAKPFEEVEVRIPYTTGMSPYSGLFDMFESKGLLVKDGNRYKHTFKDGTEVKLYEKEWNKDTVNFDRMMREWQDDDETTHGVGEELEDLATEIEE